MWRSSRPSVSSVAASASRSEKTASRRCQRWGVGRSRQTARHRPSEELAAWLRVCKGAAIGPGGLFGARRDTDFLDMASRAAAYPGWRQLGWLPVAGDGFGNFYILLTRGPLAGCVAFVEAVSGPDEITYVAASSLWSFLRFLFEAELGAKGWPFDWDVVLAADPDLARVPAELLPWGH